MLEHIYQQIIASFENQFLAGGLGLMILGSAGMMLRNVPANLWKVFLHNCTVIIDVQNDDKAYEWFLSWLGSHSYGQRSRRVSIKHVRMPNGDLRPVIVPARGNHLMFCGWRPMWLRRFKDSDAAPGSQGLSTTDVLNSLAAKETISIRVLGRDRKLVQQLLDISQQTYQICDNEFLQLNRYQWGAWTSLRKEKRPLESVMLPPAADGLIDDIKTFTSSRQWYKNLGIPYRRGYLFSGPPGTGKSCTAEAIAGELNLPIYILNLANFGNQSLEQAIAALDHSSTAVLLIEDIDTALPDRTNQPGDKAILSLGTLLNALDGLLASDNLVLIMTTNHEEKLDPALIRCGRVDKIIEFGMATETQISKAVSRFLPNATPDQLERVRQLSRPISMAALQEHLKKEALG